jgi:hypothetical protein
MASDDRVQAAKDRLAREGIHVSVRTAGQNLRVEVVRSSWSRPHTWLRVFQEFMPLNCGVEIR